MKIQGYNKVAAQKAFDQWKISGVLPSLSPEYSEIRNNLVSFIEIVQEEITDNSRKDYISDTLFGLKIYEYFNGQKWFNLRVAANDDFWRYIAVSVIPDIVAKRWGINNDTYFWKQSNRLWPKTIWWYIHLTWQNSIDETRNLLIKNMFNSDTIQGLVERTGSTKGTFVEVYREIVLQYGQLDNLVILKFKKQLTQGSDSLFRAIMRLNTARLLVSDPCLVKGGAKGYVSSIINELTCNLN